MKLSIIIPMYNSEKYIAACLDSILNSDLPKDAYEVVIVNDGSTDKGPEIAQDYVSRHDNFVCLTQENQGQSVARNYGIKECHGEYVWCVDSDDQIDASVSKGFNELVVHPDLDVLAFHLKVVTEQGEFVRYECTQPSIKHHTAMTGRDAIVSGYNPSSVCALFVRKQFITSNNLFFKEGITHQDVELSYRLFAFVRHVLFIDETPYLYILHANSTSQSINPQKKIKYLKDDIVVHQSFMNLSRQLSGDAALSAVIANRAQNVLFGMIYSLHTHRKEWKPFGISQAVVSEMKAAGVYPVKGPFDSWKKRVAVLLLNIECAIV